MLHYHSTDNKVWIDIHMKRIFYAISGEGLGHTSRALSVIDRLPDYEIHIFTFGKGYDFLKEAKYPHLHKIEGQIFYYSKNKVNYPKTIWNNRNFFFKGMKNNIKFMLEKQKELSPSIMISDLEPSLPRVAKATESKYISIDNQHRFSHCYNKNLTNYLRLYSWLTGIYVNWITPDPDQIIISTFHYDDLIVTVDQEKVCLTNGLMRKSLEETNATNDYFLLVYVRDSVQNKIINCLKDVKKEIRIYGATDKDLISKFASKDNFKFLELSPAFTKDLASCEKIISTAGNQLISEVRFYEKSILVIPEPNQWEQHVNAHHVETMGIGTKCELKDLNEEVVNEFLEGFESRCKPAPNGAHQVEEIIRKYTGA